MSFKITFFEFIASSLSIHLSMLFSKLIVYQAYELNPIIIGALKEITI